MADSSLPPIGGLQQGDQPSAGRQPQGGRRQYSMTGPRNTLMGNPPGAFVPFNQGQTVDEKLNEQFRYFRTEFMEAAYSSAVAVPMMIVEDKSGQVYKFVLNGGPKYLFEVMQSNMENIHLMRCSLSLLVMIITILRRKIPDSHGPKSGIQALSTHSVTTTDSITAWVVDALAKIGDLTAVTTCTTVLINSYNPSVQELALSLLASMLSVSDEAVSYMLLPYNVSGVPGGSLEMPVKDTGRPQLRHEITASRGGLTRPSTSNDSIGAHGVEDHHEHKLKPRIAFKKLNFSYNTMDYTTCRLPKKKKKTAKQEKLNTCLSYVLSIVLVQKNRHLLAAELADVILAMLRRNRSDVCEKIARTSTCELPAIDERKSKMEKSSKFSYNPQPEEEEEHPPTAKPLPNLVIEWAGLKILLKFLFRYEKMGAISSKGATAPIDRESVSASLRLKDEFSYAHNKVFTAACQLVAGSSIVAGQVLTLPGAEELLAYTSRHVDPNDTMASKSFTSCMSAIMIEKDHRFRRDAHSPSSPHRNGMMLHEYMHDTKEDASMFPPVMHSPLPSAQGTADSTQSRSRSGNRSAQQKAHSRSPGKQQQQQQQQQKHAHREGPAGSGHKRLGQSPKREVQHDTIQLGDRMKMKFTSEYEVETEKGELHLINSYDKKYHPHQAGELKKESNREKRKAPHNPLAYNPDNDALIGSSLETMGTTTSRPITSQTPQRSTRTTPQQQQQQQQQQSLQEDSQVSVSQESDAESEVSYRRSLVKDDEELLSRSFSAGTDFFGRLPAKPIIPLRIEPKDVIIEGEDMVRIREKFQKLADSAERSTGIKGLSEVEKIRKKFTDDIKKVYGPKNFHFVSENHNKHAEKHGTSMKSPGIGSPTRVGTSGTGIGGDAPLDPVMEDQYFAQFSDADGVALQDLPIQPNLRMEGMDFSMVDGEEFGGAGIPPPHQQQRSDGDSAPATIHGSTTTSDGPEVYGLRLENFDFDEQNLFEGFKPIFDYPPQASAGHTGNGDADPESLKNLGIGKKNKPDLEMAQTVDLILS